MSTAEQEALSWLSTIREGDLATADRARFAQWLAQSPVHVQEYLELATTWGSLQSSRSWPDLSREDLLELVRKSKHANVLAFEQARAGTTPPGRSRARILGLAAAASVFLASLIASWVHLSSPRGTQYQTTRGEQRSLVLEDGSVVQLNTLTRISVHIDDEHRRIELPAGEAFFRVAADPDRPFEVETPLATVRAHGTEFNVHNLPQGTRVAVIEGKVRVQPREAQGGPGPGNATSPRSAADPASRASPAGPVFLSAKQSIDIGTSGSASVASDSPGSMGSQSAVAWLQRRIIFENERLDAAVDEFNRYNGLQMQVGDPALGALRISGIFNADDPHALVEYLRHVQDADVRRTGNVLVIRRNTGEPPREQ